MKILFSYCRLLLVILFISIVVIWQAGAEETSALKGRVVDVSGEPVKGAMVFIYKSKDVLKTADFISAPTDIEGLFRVVLPAERYWAVARLKKAEGYGPLMPGDKHSGDPVEFEPDAGKEADKEFIIADLKDAIRMKRETMERPVRLSGRILDKDGSPLTGFYAVAYRNEEGARIPDFLSPWVDDEGRYTMYLPEGRYYVGGSDTFLPGDSLFIVERVEISTDNSKFDIIKDSR